MQLLNNVSWQSGITSEITYEQRCGTEDYNEILRLTEQLCTIFERNAFTNRMSPEQWDSIRGGFRGLVETAEVQSRYTASNLEG